jgi:hypothetical protein
MLILRIRIIRSYTHEYGKDTAKCSQSSTDLRKLPLGTGASEIRLVGYGYGFGRFFDPFGRPRPRLPNVPTALGATGSHASWFPPLHERGFLVAGFGWPSAPTRLDRPRTANHHRRPVRLLLRRNPRTRRAGRVALPCGASVSFREFSALIACRSLPSASMRPAWASARASSTFRSANVWAVSSALTNCSVC